MRSLSGGCHDPPLRPARPVRLPQARRLRLGRARRRLHQQRVRPERIRRGDIALDLVRPAPLQLWSLAEDLGRAAYLLAVRGIPPMLVGAALFGILLPGGPAQWAGLLAGLLLGPGRPLPRHRPDPAHPRPPGVLGRRAARPGRARHARRPPPGTAGIAFTLTDLLFGNLDRISSHIGQGTLDTFLIRPVNAWVQVATDRFVPARFGRVLRGAAALGYALAVLGPDPGRLWMVPVMILTGTVIFTSLWTLAAALQFVLVDAPEVGSAFTYGSGQLTQYPLTVYGRDLVRGVTYALPLAFVNWQPGLYVLGRDDPFGTPEFLRFLGPAAALLLALLAGLAWRQGSTHRAGARRWPGASAWSSGSAPRSGGTCRSRTASS